VEIFLITKYAAIYHTHSSVDTSICTDDTKFIPAIQIAMNKI